jgi:hypothetical protein
LVQVSHPVQERKGKMKIHIKQIKGKHE